MRRMGVMCFDGVPGEWDVSGVSAVSAGDR